MEVLVEVEQCISRIKHMPHYWRLDGKAVKPEDLQRGHRFLAMCNGRQSDLPTTISTVLLSILRARAEHFLYPNCALYMADNTIDKLMEMFRAIPNPSITSFAAGIFNAQMQLMGLSIVRDNLVIPDQFVLRTIRGENPGCMIAKGPVFAHG